MTLEQVTQIVENIRQQYAPDKRTALFATQIHQENQLISISGETNLPQAADALLEQLQGSGVQTALRLLPGDELGDKPLAIINLSVANLRVQPQHEAELSTQALLGTPVQLLRQQENWFLVQTPDGYLAWTEGGGLARMDQQQFDRWKQAPKVIFLPAFGFAYSQAGLHSQTVSDLVAGNVLQLLDKKDIFTEVQYPDGRRAYLETAACEHLQHWLDTRQPSGQNISAAARRFIGVPYFWGGTSFKGVDCSGLTKMAYFLNGIQLSRDASQQIREGAAVDTAEGFERLLPGDLLFFGKPATGEQPERVVHVGIWLGNHEFIHAGGGMVRINSLDPGAANYHENEHKRYLRARRMLGAPLALPGLAAIY